MQKDKFVRAKRIMDFISLNGVSELKNLTGRNNLQKDEIINFIAVLIFFLSKLGKSQEFIKFLREAK